MPLLIEMGQLDSSIEMLPRQTTLGLPCGSVHSDATLVSGEVFFSCGGVRPCSNRFVSGGAIFLAVLHIIAAGE
ncbi:hypothetical protein J3F84DRAFT_377330 [Trichoderma pleuroticola]